MIVTFLGHRDFIPDNECKERMISIFDEIVGDNAVEFYFGGYA